MKVLFIATVAEGHQLILHVRTLTQEALRRGWEPHLLVPEAATQHPTFQVLREEFGEKLPFSIMPDPFYKYTGKFMKHTLPVVGQDFKHHRAFGEGFKNLPSGYRPDVIYLLNADHLEMSMSLKGTPFANVPVTGMLFGKTFHYAPMGIPVPLPKVDRYLQKPLFLRLLKNPNIVALNVIDPLLTKYMEKTKPAGWEKIHFVPDIGKLQIFSREQSMRAELGIADDKFVVMNFGWLHPRKGIHELLCALEHPDWPSNGCVLMVGSMRPQAKEILETERAQKLVDEGKLFLRTGFADDEVEGKCFAAADAVWLGYRGHWGMSGVLVQACIAGKPILSMPQGLISWYTKEYGIGEIIDIDNPQSICRAVQMLASDTKLYWTYQENCLELGKLHAPGVFERTICDMLAKVAK